jgi:hypothetical protein
MPQKKRYGLDRATFKSRAAMEKQAKQDRAKLEEMGVECELRYYVMPDRLFTYTVVRDRDELPYERIF